MRSMPARRLFLVVATSAAVSLAVASHSIAEERAAHGKAGKDLATAQQWLRYAASQAAAVPLDETQAPSFDVLDLVGEAQVKAGDTAGALV